MSDEPSSSRARQHTDDPNTRDVLDRRARNGHEAGSERAQRNRRAFNKKREAFLADLMRNVDLLVYAELSAVYYMDCSFLRFIMRGFVQFVLLTPKPAVFPDPPNARPIGLILGTNILCLILHAYFLRPEAGEETRGYLHGGLAMDFIGQKGPISKFHLLALDLLVMILQLVQLSVMTVKKKAKAAAEGSLQPGSTPARAPAPPAAAQQDLDYEERGQLRADHQTVDIELQELNPDSTAARRPQVAVEQPQTDDNDQDHDDQGERDRLLETTDAPRSDRHIFDAFNSGEIMIADLNLWNTVGEQMMLTREAVEEAGEASNTSAGSGNNSAGASFTGSGLNLRFRIGNRVWGL